MASRLVADGYVFENTNNPEVLDKEESEADLTSTNTNDLMEVTENNVKFIISPQSGQKTSWYCDQVNEFILSSCYKL